MNYILQLGNIRGYSAAFFLFIPFLKYSDLSKSD